MKTRIEQFITLLEEKKFFEAHEVLEELWFPKRFEKDKEIQLLRGLINAAVSFELHKRKRHLASAKVWKNYLKYKDYYLSLSPNKRHLYGLAIQKIEQLQSQIKE